MEDIYMIAFLKVILFVKAFASPIISIHSYLEAGWAEFSWAEGMISNLVWGIIIMPIYPVIQCITIQAKQEMQWNLDL